MRREQPRTLDHLPLFVIVEPILTRLEAGNDRMPRCCNMLGCMLTWRTVAASDVPAFRASAEMEPPTFRRRQAFHTPISAWLRSGVDSALISLHFRFILTFDVTSFRLPTHRPVDCELCTMRSRLAHLVSHSSKRQPDSAIGRWYWRSFGLQAQGIRVRATFLAMCLMRTLVLVDTFVQ
jgi:hypothetical protein